jgi:hypothetical protein
MDSVVPKPPASRQETFKAIQLLWDLAFEHFKESGFNQLAASAMNRDS